MRISTEIYYGIHQFGNEFFLNRMTVLKENKLILGERMEKEKAISELTVNSQRIRMRIEITPKLETVV